MKKTAQLILGTIALSLAIHSCRPEAHKDLGVPASNIAAIAGTWKLAKVLQTDEDASRKGFPYKVMDVTTAFPYTDFTFTLNANGSTPTTFTTTPGNAPKIIRLASGNWVADDPAYPKVLSLINGTDTARVTLGSYPGGASPLLKLRVERRDAANKLLISYSYEFSKQ